MHLNDGPLGLSGDGRHLRASAPWREIWVAPWSCCPKAPPCLPISVDPCLDPYPRPGASLRSAPHAPAGLSPRLHSLVETPPPVPAWGSLLSPPTLRHRGHGGEREAVPLRPDGLRPPLHHQRQRVPWRVARPQPRHHPLRQLRLLHAHRVPVHHHGGLDRRPLLGGSGPEPAGYPLTRGLGPLVGLPVLAPGVPTAPLPSSILGGGVGVPPVSAAPGAVRVETRSLVASVSAPALSPSLAVSDSPLMARNLRFPEGGRALRVSLLTAGQGCSPIKRRLDIRSLGCRIKIPAPQSGS